MSNLRLGGKVVAVAAGDDQNHVEKSGQTAWAALRAAHASVGQMPTSQILVSLLYQARTHFEQNTYHAPRAW